MRRRLAGDQPLSPGGLIVAKIGTLRDRQQRIKDFSILNRTFHCPRAAADAE